MDQSMMGATRTMRHVLNPLVALILLQVPGGSGAAAQGCLAPPRPLAPSDPEAAREYADLIRRDFETYVIDIQTYLRCLDAERARAFEEAQEVSEEYGRFVEAVSR